MTSTPAVSPDPATTTTVVEPVAPSTRLGTVVLNAAIALVLVSLATSIVLALLGAPYVERSEGSFNFNFQFGDPRPTVSALGLASPLHALVGALIGLWIIVQSIVAIALNRGRGAAIAALVLAVVAPIMSIALYFIVLLAAG